MADLQSSDGNSIRAVETIVRSKRFQPYLLIAVGVASGWFAKTLDIKADLASVHTELAASRAGQQTGFRDINNRLDELLSQSDDKPGRFTRLERGQRYAWNILAQTWASAYGGETGSVRKLKKAAAEDYKGAYQGRIDDGTAPTAAFDEVVRVISIR